MSQSLLPITEIARKLNLPEGYFEPIGRLGAKLNLDLLSDPAFPVRGKLILVTATTPTASGEGKTVTSIGLTQGLERIGCKSIITSREPSLGPVFGMKGGAAGGGEVADRAQPEDQPAFPRRLSRHHVGPQSACRAHRRPRLPWQ